MTIKNVFIHRGSKTKDMGPGQRELLEREYRDTQRESDQLQKEYDRLQAKRESGRFEPSERARMEELDKKLNALVRQRQTLRERISKATDSLLGIE